RTAGARTAARRGTPPDRVSGTAYICLTCGVQQAPSVSAPARCPICEDERQYVRQGGQAWTTLDELAAQGNRVELRELEPGLVGVGAQPAVGIGQRALLVRTPGGNFLWDCFGFIDETSVDAIRAMGGTAGPRAMASAWSSAPLGATSSGSERRVTSNQGLQTDRYRGT